MRLADTLYDWLLEGPAPDCDRILGQALTQAEPEWAERIIEVLLTRRCDASWRALLEHYQHLPETAQRQVRADGLLLREGLSLALRSSSTEARLNALAAVQDNPPASLAYLLTDTLRDQELEIRAAAAAALTRCAENVLEAEEELEQASAGSQQIERVQIARAHVVQALAEALRSFELHRRVDVLEVCLWFTRDLSDEIWKILDAPRSHARTLAGERFRTWNSPRLAAFLLSALKHPSYRREALQMLSNWDTPAHCRVLLRESRFLEDPEVRRRLSALQQPRWLASLHPELTDLPLGLRPRAAHWVLHLGLDPYVKLERLSSWSRSSDVALHRAAVYALAALPDAGVLERMEVVAESDSPLAHFARWFVRARQMELVRERGNRNRMAPEPEEAASSDVDFALLWQVCRRTEPNMRMELIEVIRENAAVWRSRLRSSFRSPDPRDRILALQVVSTQELALRFRQDLRQLRDDQVAGIRNLARTLIDSVSNKQESEVVADAAHFDAPDQAARADLQHLLKKMVQGQEDPTSPTTVADLRSLMQNVYGHQTEGARS